MTEQENDKKLQELGCDLVKKVKIIFAIFLGNNKNNAIDADAKKSLAILNSVLAAVFYDLMENSIRKEGHLQAINQFHNILMKLYEEKKINKKV